MATMTIPSQDFVDAVAFEMARGIDSAVENWMAAMEQALADPQLTTLGRLHAAKEVLENYKQLTGKTALRLWRPACPENRYGQ